MINAVCASQFPPKKVMEEQGLIAWIDAHEGVPIAYLHTNKLFAAFVDDGSAAELMFTDIDSAGFAALKRVAKKKLLKRFEATEPLLIGKNNFDISWPLIPAEPGDVVHLKEIRDRVFGFGRGKAISSATTLRVWADAGARCMYRGCGENLSRITLSTKLGQIAYLAHIVASDPDGPRGGSRSHELSDHPDNIMLMCDAHHRLIDRIDEAGHTSAVLHDMRIKHVSLVHYLLESTKYPPTVMMTLLADLADIATNASDSDLKNAIINQQLSPFSSPKHEIRRRQRDLRTKPDFWAHLLDEHEREIFQYQRNIKEALLNHTVAIFPLHLVPILVLAGRIAGEASAIKVFQYDRDKQTWSWDPEVSPYPRNAISLVIANRGSSAEVVISIELTAPIDVDAIPLTLMQRINNGEISWIRIKHVEPNHNCIRHPDDLENFTQVARRAISLMQDEIRAVVIHLIGVSPASALFRFGQLLQAGHHPQYIVYDRPNNEVSFNPGLSICGDRVTVAHNDISINIKTLPLR